MEAADSPILELVGLAVVLLGVYWSIRGVGQLFERHNVILVIFYLVFLFPIAFCHAFLLGVFGHSKKQRLKNEIEKEVDFQLSVEKEKAKRR